MAPEAKIAEYYNFTVDGDAAGGFKLLSTFAGAGVGLLAFKAVPAGRSRTMFSLFPDDGAKMRDGARKAGLSLDGPHYALIVKGYTDNPGECADAHERLAKAGVEVLESSGIADIKDSWGVVFYLRPEDREKAMSAFSR